MNILVALWSDLASKASIANFARRMRFTEFYPKFAIGVKDDEYLMVFELGSTLYTKFSQSLIDAGYEVLGGGYIYLTQSRIKEIEWGSESMMRKWGYDRPDDETLLDCIKEQLQSDLVAD